MLIASQLIDLPKFYKGSQNIESATKIHNIETITIQFLPSFIESSIIIIDTKKSQLIFQHSGLKKKIVPVYSEKKIVGYEKPKPFLVHLTSIDSIRLNDNILSEMNRNDFIDTEVGAIDGYCANIAFFLADSTVREVDIRNSTSQNQYSLFKFIFDVIQKQKHDNHSKLYFDHLERMVMN